MRYALPVLAFLVAGCADREPAPAREPTPDTVEARAPVSPLAQDTLIARPQPVDTLGDVLLLSAGPERVTAIGLLRDDQIYAVPVGDMVDTASNRFRAQWFTRGRSYFLYHHGTQVGTLTVRQPENPVCVGLSASVLGTEGRSSSEPTLALNRHLRTPQAIVSAPTPADSAALLAAARAELRRRMVPEDSARPLVLHSGLVVADSGMGKILVGSARLNSPDEDTTQVAVLLVLRAGEVDVLAYTNGPRYDAVDYWVWDVVDLVGDSQPEVIVKNQYEVWYYDRTKDESHDYSIYSRTAEGWRLRYQGGGSGC